MVIQNFPNMLTLVRLRKHLRQFLVQLKGDSFAALWLAVFLKIHLNLFLVRLPWIDNRNKKKFNFISTGNSMEHIPKIIF